MKNQGIQQFNYETFKSAYDSDPRLQKIVKNFDQNKIELSSGDAVDELPASSTSNSDSVGKMAKRATDLGDL